MDCNYQFKFITIGDTGVGKSCLMWKFVEDSFNHEQDPTPGSEIGFKTINVADDTINLLIWDTAGLDIFRSMGETFINDAVGVILVYDITRRETFDHLPSWLEKIKNQIHPNAIVILVGNKSDLNIQRQVSSEQGRTFAENHGMVFFEASAKTSYNVEQVFTEPAISIHEKIVRNVIKISRDSVGVVKGVGRTDNPQDGGVGCFFM